MVITAEDAMQTSKDAVEKSDENMKHHMNTLEGWGTKWEKRNYTDKKEL